MVWGNVKDDTGKIDNYIGRNPKNRLQNIVLDEVTRMIENGFCDKNAIVKKIKKTYKNRYFQIIRSN